MIKFFFPLVLLCVLASCSPRVGAIDEPLTDNNIYDINRKVISQQFDFDKHGNIYYVELIQSERQYFVNIFKVAKKHLNHSPQKTLYKGDSMSVIFSGHPTGFAIEDTPDGPYIWICNYASKLRNKHYWLSQTISRMKFIPNTMRMPDDEGVEHFWFPHRSDINIALDTKHNLAAFSFYYTHEDEIKKNIDMKRNRRIRVYKLSDILKSPLEEVTLPQKWYRGGDGAPLPYDSVNVTLKLHNLTHILPIAEVGTHRAGNSLKINDGPWQGFDVDKDIIWFSEGNTKTGTYITGYAFDNSIASRRTKVLSSDYCPEWDKYGICDSAKHQYENEGVRVWKGHLYLGMFTRKTGNGYRSNIMKFKRKKFK